MGKVSAPDGLDRPDSQVSDPTVYAWLSRFGAEKSSPPGPNNSTTTVGENMQFKLGVGKVVRPSPLSVQPRPS